MDEAKADILMYFQTKDDGRVDGESNLAIDKDDKFMKGFEQAKDATSYGNFFEVSDFNFSLKLNAAETDGANIKSKAKIAVQAGTHGGAQKAPDEYDRWRSAKPEQLKDMKYPIEFGTFSFKRMLDAASPMFFQNCAKQISFSKAVLVKRIQAKKGNDQVSVGFMRLEFKDVLITKVSWDDGDVVKESCEFKCANMTVLYKTQMSDGTLLPEVQAVWDRDTDGRPPKPDGAPGGG